MAREWEELEHSLVGDYTVFNVYRRIARSPRTGSEHPFYLIDAADWVNVIPMTPDGKLVMVEQYRHGSGRLTLEVPGGIIDDADASPAHAARREMVEETGYDGDHIEYLGVVSPNPAVHMNQCYTYLVRDVRRVEEQELDAAEDIVVHLVDPDQVPDLIAEGRISHALVISAFYLLQNTENGKAT